MAMGMIGAAVVGRLWVGVLLALLTGAGSDGDGAGAGHAAPAAPILHRARHDRRQHELCSAGRIVCRSAGEKGWLIAVFVVAGEAAILLTASTMPGALPDWLLALLPAQWASTAIQTALTGTGTRAASSPLFALAGTAAATLFVARLWPRRWPYLVMFTVWLGLSALVWHRPGPPMPRADLVIAAAPAGPIAPIATTAPDAATASALARVKRQIEKWPAAAEPDPTNARATCC